MKALLYETAKDSFDAMNDRAINFSWAGNQAQKNRVRIYNNQTLELVYDQIQITQKLVHTIHKNTLTNGVTYKITVAVITSDEVESEQSDAVLFTCCSTPVFTISGVTDNQIVRASSYGIGLNYIQPENVLLQQYNVFLLNYNKEVIFTTGTQYSTDNISILLTGLEDDHVYTVYATGVIGNNMEIETPPVVFSVDYNHNENFVICNVLNIKDIGAVRVESNIVTHDGILSGSEIYFDGTTIDLRDGTVSYGDVDIKNNFELALKLKHDDAMLNKTFMWISGPHFEVTFSMYSCYVDILSVLNAGDSSSVAGITLNGGNSSTLPSEYVKMPLSLGAKKDTKILGYYYEAAINLRGNRFIYHSNNYEKPQYLDEIFFRFKIKDKKPTFWVLGCIEI